MFILNTAGAQKLLPNPRGFFQENGRGRHPGPHSPSLPQPFVCSRSPENPGLMSTQRCVPPYRAPGPALGAEREFRSRRNLGAPGGRRRLPCQGTWGQRWAVPGPTAGVLPAETQSGPVCWPLAGPATRLCTDSGLASLSPAPKSFDSAPALALCSWPG